MKTTCDRPSSEAAPASGAIAPEDSFLVQIRGTSRPADGLLVGRVEHLHSGASQPFGSLSELHEFLATRFSGAVHAASFDCGSGRSEPNQS